MDFTREPIIETVITPKDSYQLVIKNSKSGGAEHVVDAVEVISFGTTYFLRSLEKPAAFLLPFAEYEITEKKVSKVALKKPQVQKTIKIETKDKNSPQEDVDSDIEMEKEKKEEAKADKPKSSRRKKAAAKKAEAKEKREEAKKEVSEEAFSETEKSAPRSLLPPPTTLISDQILRYKDYLQTEEAAPLPESEGKAPISAEEVEGVLLPTPEANEAKDELTSVEVPLSVMKEADDFINQAQDEMFNQSLEETPLKEEEESVALKLNCTTPPPLIMDQEES